MNDLHRGKTRIDFSPQEIKELRDLVVKQIKEGPLLEVMESHLPGLLNKLSRASKRIEPPVTAQP